MSANGFPDLAPVQITRWHTNTSLPMTCGHRHVTGQTVYANADESIVVCEGCKFVYEPAS